VCEAAKGIRSSKRCCCRLIGLNPPRLSWDAADITVLKKKSEGDKGLAIVEGFAGYQIWLFELCTTVACREVLFGRDVAACRVLRAVCCVPCVHAVCFVLCCALCAVH
jgi:hypothetical protein